MAGSISILLAGLGLPLLILAQGSAGPCSNGFFYNTRACNNSRLDSCQTGLTAANFSGQEDTITYRDSALPNGTLSINWKATLAGYAPDSGYIDPTSKQSIVSSLWAAPSSPYDLNAGNNPFSACAIVFGSSSVNSPAFGLTDNSLDLAQKDKGDCSSFAPSECRTALTNEAAKVAGWNVNNPSTSSTGQSNLTAGLATMNTVCSNILNALNISTNENLASCRPYFNLTNLNYLPQPLTGAPVSRPYCNAQFASQQWSLYTHLPLNYTAGDSALNSEHYSWLYYRLYTVLTVIFPAANASQTSRVNSTAAYLNCVRASDGTGYRLAALPSGTLVSNPSSTPSSGSGSGSSSNSNSTVPSGDDLSGGAIAGIVVGVVAGVVLLAGLGLLLLRHRRKRAAATWHPAAGELPAGDEKRAHPLYAEHSGAERFEADGGGAPHTELEAREKQLELETLEKKTELPTPNDERERSPVEMPAADHEVQKL